MPPPSSGGRHPAIGEEWCRSLRLFELVLGNLLSNADKYSPSGSPIDVLLSAEDGMAPIEVQDRGIGIPDGTADEMFNAFFRADRARATASVMGVGLAVCKRIVEAHGGTVWARPRDAGGEVVGFALPLTSETYETAD